jgi:hypothetical protein
MNPEEIEKKVKGYIEMVEQFKLWFLQDIPHAIGTLAILLLVAAIFSIRKRLGDNLADITDNIISQLTLVGTNHFSNYSFNLRYKKHIAFEHRVFNVRGLRIQGAFTLEVEKVYVGLKIAPSANPNKANNLIQSSDLGFFNTRLKNIGGYWCARLW